MPVFSYLAVPKEGQKQLLINELRSMPHCEIFPADNEELIILLTETVSAAAERQLQNKIKKLDSLQNLSMAYGHSGQ